MSQWLSISGLEDPSVMEYFENPDFRQIAAFFLGWVFLYSIQSIACSKISHVIIRRLWPSFHRPFPSVHPENLHRALNPASPGKSSVLDSPFVHHPSLQHENEDRVLVLMLAVCFACASIAQFASLLQFSPRHGETACIFVVAWGGMAAQAARLIGLLILGGELAKLGIMRKEMYIYWALLGLTLGLIFANNAIGVGTTRFVQQLGISWCYKRHFMPSGLTSSLLLVLLDVYVVARTLTFITHPFLRWRHQIEAIADFRIRRALSLLLLEVLTITSSAIPTNILVDFVPFSLGAIIVLAAFNSPMEPKVKGESVQFSDTREPSMHDAPAPSARSMSTTRLSVQTMLSPALSSSAIRSERSSSSSEYSSESRRSIETFIQSINGQNNAPQHNPSPTDIPSTLKSRSSTETSPSPKSLPRRLILPSQAKYAEQFEQEQSLPTGPSWKKQSRPHVLISSSDDHYDLASESGRPLAPSILGSDIIRANSSASVNPTGVTRHQPESTMATPVSIFSPVSRDSMLSPYSTPRYSFSASRTRNPSSPSRENYERSVADPQHAFPHVLLRKSTFGEGKSTVSSSRRTSSGTGVTLPIPALSLPSKTPPGLTSPRGTLGSVSSRTRHAATPSGPRPLLPVLESLRSPSTGLQ